MEELRGDDDPYADELTFPEELHRVIADRLMPEGLFGIPKREIIVDGFELTITTTIRFTRRYDRIEILAVTHFPGGRIIMGKQISLMPGETKQIEVHGFTADGTDVGIVPATITGTDNHTIQVSDRGDGHGSVSAVGAAGSSADINADDGQGHTDTAHGTIEGEPAPIIDHIEIVEVGQPTIEFADDPALSATDAAKIPPPDTNAVPG